MWAAGLPRNIDLQGDQEYRASSQGFRWDNLLSYLIRSRQRCVVVPEQLWHGADLLLVYACGSGEHGQLGSGSTGERISTGNKVAFDVFTTPSKSLEPPPCVLAHLHSSSG